MKQKKIKRLAALTLCLCLILGLMPFSTADVSAKPGKTELTSEGEDKDMLGLPDSASQIENYTGSDHPYGRAGWFNINPVSELSVFASLEGQNRYRDYSFARDNAGNVTGIRPQDVKVPKYSSIDGNKNLLNATDSKSRDYRFAQSVAFDPGTPATKANDPSGKGQDRYLATVAYNRDEQFMYLIVSEADNTGKELAKINLSATNTTEDFNHFYNSDSLLSHRYRGTFSIAAGDFNGDGEDSIIVYRPIMAKEGECAPVLSEYRFNPSTNQISYYEGDLNQDLYGDSGLGPFTKSSDTNAAPMTAKDFYTSEKDKRTRNTPVIQMSAEDTDRDGRDELVVAAGFANVNGNADYVPQLGSQLVIFERGGKDNAWTKSLQTALSPDNGGTKAKGRLRYAGVTVGSIITESTGTDFPEIIAAGYVDKASNSGHDIQKDIAAYIYRCDSIDNNYLSKYSLVAQNEKIGKNPVSENFDQKDNYLDTVQVTAFAAKGAGQAEYVVIEGMVWGYEHDEEKQQTVFKKVFTPNLFHASEGSINGARITHNNVQEAVAGNFDGNTDGREQVIGLLVYRQFDSNNYYYRMVTLGLQEGSDSTWQWKDNNEKNWRWFYTNANDYEVYQKGASVVSLAAVDVDRFQDGTLGKIQSRVDNYTKPGVLAIMEAAPYFKEVKAGVRNGGTSYGTSAETGKAASTSNTVSANVLFGYEYEASGMGGGFEANFEHKSTWSSTKSTSTTFSTEYYNDSDDNQVLVYRAPLSHYIYQTILPDGTSGQMNIVVQGSFATNMVPIKTYNEAAETYGLKPIDESMLGIPGSPADYNKGLPLNSKKSYQAPETSSYSSGGTTKQSITYTEGQETSYEYSFGVSLQGYGLAGGVKFGGGVGYEHARNNTTINTNSVTKEGAVSGRESNVPNTYDFDWRFATWEIDLNDSEVPVLGYLVNNVSSPPAPPINLSITDETETTLTLNWEHNSRQAVKYNIYRYMPDYPQKPYVKIGSVNGAEREFIVTELSPGTTYQYVIRSEGYVKGKLTESVISEVAIGTTLDVGGVRPQITGPGDTTAVVGGTARFEVSVNLPSLYTHYDYVWQEKQVGGQWENLKSGSGKVLEIANITEEHEGRKYRYVVTAYKSDGTPITYYSQAATLTLGKIKSVVSLSLGFGYTPPGGKGTVVNPYYGAADRKVETSEGSEFQPGETFRVAASVRDVQNEDCFIHGVHLETGETFNLTVKLEGLSPSVDWKPDAPGLYALTAYYPGSDTRQPGYSESLYFQSVEAGDRQYRLALLGNKQKILQNSAEYGTIIRKAKLYYKEVTWEEQDGKSQIKLSGEQEYISDNLSFTNTLTAGDKADIIKDPFGAAGTAAYRPDNVGTHTISVSEDGVKLAQAVLKITPRLISVRPAWTGTLPPDTIGEIGVEVVPGTPQLAAGDILEGSWFSIYSDLYDVNGSRIPEIEGNIAIRVSRKGIPLEDQTDAYKRFTNCYQIITQYRNTNIEKDSYNVNYAVALGSEAGGTLDGRYGENKTEFKTGANIKNGTTVEFIATPNQTYAVDQWMNNGVPISPTDYNYTYNADRTVMTIDYLQSALDITVSYKKTDDILLYYQSENKNRGTISAVYDSGEGDVKIDDGNTVPLGSDITLTANPKPAMVVQKWMVNGKEYCWEDGKTPYLENRLTLQNVNRTNDVTVYFAPDEQYQLSVASVYEDGSAASKDPVISDYAGKTIKPGKMTGGKRLNFKAENLDDSAIIEWRISKKGEGFVKIPGSEYQSQISLLGGINENSTVQVVYTKEEVTVKVTPETVRLAGGEQQQFTAEVQGNENWETIPPQDVKWSVKGGLSDNTTITKTGLLSVGEDETAEQITVSAVSAWAPYSAEGKAVTSIYELVPPTGKILMGNYKWNEFKDIETFELFFKDEQEITITAEDNSKKDVTIEYFLSADKLTLEDAKAKAEGWNTYSKPFSVKPDSKFIVYVRLTDASGNRTYISSDGIVLDETPPVITGAENGVSYDTALNITVTDDYLEIVTVDDVEQPVAGGSSYIALTENKEYTINAKDKTGNETIYKVTVKIPETSYVLIFDADGGTPVPSIQTLKAGETPVTVKEPVKSGYVFLGWYNDVDEFIDLSGFTMPEYNVTLTAKWEESEIQPTIYTLTFDAAGGTPVPEPQLLEAGVIPVDVENPIKEGYTFQGWYNDGGEKIELSEFMMPDSDVTLKAKWEETVIPAATYTLTFDTAGGEPVPPVQTLEVGETPKEVENPTKKGCTFEGWYNEEGQKINLSEFRMPETNMTLTAKWKEADIPAATYTLTFDTAGGEPVPPVQTLGEGEIPKEVENPVKKGCTFEGWYNEEGQKINLSEFKMPKNNITLTARWKSNTSNTYVLTVENGSGSGNYEAGQKVSIAAEVPSGKIFKRWELKSGDGVIEDAKNKKTTFTVAEEDAVVVAVLEDAKPSDPAQPSKPSTSGGGSRPTGSSGTKDTPRTGDQTMIWPLWTAILSLGVIGLTAAKWKRHKRK